VGNEGKSKTIWGGINRKTLAVDINKRDALIKSLIKLKE